MNKLMFLYDLPGFTIVFLFLLRIEWLCGNDFKFSLIFLSFLFLFLLSFLIEFTDFLEWKGSPVMLRISLISLLFFRFFLYVFKKIYKRNPINTFWEFNKKPIQDVVFNLVFWIFGLGLSIVISSKF